MSYIGRNIKTLRKHRSITQQQLADYLYIKRPVIGAYEEERAEPRMDTLQKMASFFDLTLEELSAGLISLAWLEDRRAGDKDSNETSRRSGARILSITTGEDEEENIELVPLKASAGYLNGYSDPEFISSLPRFRLPMLKGGTFRAFELKGDSMLPLLSGTYIIGEYVDNWHLIKNAETYVVLSAEEGIVYKRIKNKLSVNNTLQLVSDNPAYEPYSIKASDILEVWKARAYIGMQLPNPEPERR